jgi:sulfoxide reductase heme-binding subunit YedZ
VVFLLALLPFALLVARTFGVGGLNLGANPIQALTDELGLWALRFLLATLALTPLRRLTGMTRVLLFRRMLGLFAYFYLLLHVTLYVGIDQRLDLTILWEDVLKRPWITLGFTAFLLLTPLALTSTRGMMRRLGRSWQRLHYAIYPAAALGCWHFYWQVKRDVRAPLLYASLYAILMAYRLYHRHRRRTQAPAAATA